MTQSSNEPDSAISEADEADVQEQQQNPEGDMPDGADPDLNRLERGLGGDGSEGDVVGQSQD